MKEAEPVREEAETLDSILGASEEVTEEPKKEVINQELTTTDTKYPADEIPDFDQETGEVLEEISLFEGNTINVKE